MTQRLQVRPRQPKVRPIANAHDVVNVHRRSPAIRLAADRVARQEPTAKSPPLRVVPSIRRRWPLRLSLTTQSLSARCLDRGLSSARRSTRHHALHQSKKFNLSDRNFAPRYGRPGYAIQGFDPPYHFRGGVDGLHSLRTRALSHSRVARAPEKPDALRGQQSASSAISRM